MSRIGPCFEALQRAGRKALIPYVAAGDPEPAATLPLLRTLVAGGADIIELGVPFTDPIADGPVIQAACERALAHGVHLGQVLEMVRGFREDNDTTPIVLMGYLNPILAMGVERFAGEARDAGVDGVLVVDLPPEEADEVNDTLRSHGLDPIYLVAPTTTEERTARICNASAGFLYYVSLRGVTGADTLDIDEIAKRVHGLRTLTPTPVVVGFGIKDGTMAERLGRAADGVVVGSALVRLIEGHANSVEQMTRAVAALMGELRNGLDTAQAA